MQKYVSIDSITNESTDKVIFNDENNEFTGSFNVIKDSVKTNITEVFSSKEDVSELSTKIDDVNNSISEIENLIPKDASSANQLADKEFVTDSISTNSATFMGTFDSVSKLPTTGIDNNDYAIVKTETDVNNQTYTRYKYDGSKWVEEFTLNNTPFNSEQWAAINSGITSTTLNGYSRTNHTHSKADIDDFPTDVSDFTNNANYISSDDIIEQINCSKLAVSSLTVDGKDVSLDGHTHTISDIENLPSHSENTSKQIKTAETLEDIITSLSSFLEGLK